MSLMGLFFILVFSVALAYLRRQGVFESPFIQEGEVPTFHENGGIPLNAARTGLVIFLGVALCLFSLLSVAFLMRMGGSDWRPFPIPRVLWLNTAILVASCGALRIASSAAEDGNCERMRSALSAGVLASLFFLLGQLWAWGEMTANGFYASRNPANAFFFLFTGAHALHLSGGLIVVLRAKLRARQELSKSLALSVELCATYWHFFLMIWILLLAMMVGPANNLGAICRRLLA